MLQLQAEAERTAGTPQTALHTSQGETQRGGPALTACSPPHGPVQLAVAQPAPRLRRTAPLPSVLFLTTHVGSDSASGSCGGKWPGAGTALRRWPHGSHCPEYFFPDGHWAARPPHEVSAQIPSARPRARGLHGLCSRPQLPSQVCRSCAQNVPAHSRCAFSEGKRPAALSPATLQGSPAAGQPRPEQRGPSPSPGLTSLPPPRPAPGKPALFSIA